MANDRQAAVVAEARALAARIDEELNAYEALQARYDILNSESTNFAAGYFSSPQEITGNDLLGFFTSRSGLRNAATSQFDAWRAAARKIRT